MLVAKLEINGRPVGTVRIVRGADHPKLKRAYYYGFTATLDTDVPGYSVHQGEVVHSYDNGAAALLAKVMRAIVKQQKAAKHDRAAKIHNDSN